MLKKYLLLACATCLALAQVVAEPLVSITKVTPFATDNSVRIELRLLASDNVQQLLVAATITNANDGSILWQGNLSSPSLEKGKELRHIQTIEKLQPKLWSPSSPNLYNLSVEVGSGKQVVRFGFRKFEMRNSNFYLNGKPIFLRGNAINPPNRGIPKELEASKAFARDYVRFMKSININIIRIPENQDWEDVCDEEGMMIFAGRYGRPTTATQDGPPKDFEKAIEAYKEKDLGPFASHPSVMIYIMSNEQPYEGDKGDAYREFFSRAHKELKKWDDTRLYICNAGYGLGRSADIYDVHRYWGWYYNTFLTYENLRSEEKWLNEGQEQPVTFTECVGNYTGVDGRFNLCSRTKQPASQKCWTGHAPDSLQSDMALTYQAFVLKNATEMFRRMRAQNHRLSGVMPFTIMFFNWDGVQSFSQMNPKPAAYQYRVSYQPVLLSWEMWQSQVYAGATLSGYMHVVNDDDKFTDLNNANIKWELQDAKGKAVMSGVTEPFSVLYYATKRLLFNIKLRADLPTAYYTLVGNIVKDGVTISTNTSKHFIAGKTWNTQTEKLSRSLVLYDSKGTTASLLTNKKISFTKVGNLKQLNPKTTLIIGEESWDENLTAAAADLKNFVAQGGRVLCLRQNRENFNADWLPVKVKMLEYSANSMQYLSPEISYCDGMNINLERPQHQLFKGLTREQFLLWSDYSKFDETQKDKFPKIYPVSQGFSIDNQNMDKVAVFANYSRGLTAMALCEFFDGKGSVILSGFDVVARGNIDPVADKLFTNLVAYAATVDKQHAKYPYIDSPIIWGDFVSERGLVTGAYYGLLLNTTPIIPEGIEEEKKLTVDAEGFQFAGAYGGWNSSPGIQYVPNGRRPFAPLYFSAGGNSVADKKKSETIGEGCFFAQIPKGKARVINEVENPSGKDLEIEISVNDTNKKTYSIPAKQRIALELPMTGKPELVKVFFKGSRQLVIHKTTFE